MARNPARGNHAPLSRPAAPAHPARRKPQFRITGTLIGMSAAAIVSVYGIGYLNTAAASQAADSGIVSMTSAGSSGPSAAQPALQRQSSTNSAPASTPAKGATPSSASAYNDGTYTGVGSSRHGSIQASVVITGGKIVSANVTNCGTRYPCSKVTSLVSQVVNRQAPPVNYVSGATDSSSAYTQAVKSALATASA